MVIQVLNVFYGDMPEAVFNTEVFFKNSYDDEWIVDDFSKQMIADVDKSRVLGTGVIDSPVPGKIAPERLSIRGRIFLIFAIMKKRALKRFFLSGEA